MFRIRFFGLLTAALCLLGLAVPVSGAEVESGSVYCFCASDFSEEASITGICITALPESSHGTLLLGSRVIQPGDILTAEQAAQMTFHPLRTTVDQTAVVEYLPVFSDYVAANSAMTISIRGREDKAPVAEDSAAETYKNLANTGKLKVSDPEGQELTFTVTRQPKRGNVTIQSDGSFTYTPKKNKVGVDSFTYTATDPAGNLSREATVTITILKPASAGQYTDTAGRDCRFSAEWMKHTGIFVGESLAEKSCFQPDKEVTRGEFTAMLVKTLEIPTDDGLTYTGYTDSVPQWLQPYLAAAVRAGLTAGLPNQETFGAGEVVTWAEAAVMLENGLDVPVSGELGMELAEETALTRDQAAQILYQTRKLKEEKNMVFSM